GGIAADAWVDNVQTDLVEILEVVGRVKVKFHLYGQIARLGLLVDLLRDGQIDEVFALVAIQVGNHQLAGEGAALADGLFLSVAVVKTNGQIAADRLLTGPQGLLAPAETKQRVPSAQRVKEKQLFVVLFARMYPKSSLFRCFIASRYQL